jgi:YfiH family protein
MGADLPVVEVDLGPGVRAGFTTRVGGVSGAGGVSVAGYGQLNLGLEVGDDPRRVRANRETVARWLGAPVVFAHQVHGAGVRIVARLPASGRAVVGDGDALVTRSVRLGVGVLVADCVPVLLADAASGIVAAVHAGRRGLVAGVVLRAVDEMVAEGARLTQIVAVVGPAICGACYEVPAAMQAEVGAAVRDTTSVTSWGTPALDLAAGAAAQLRDRGVRRVSRLNMCTREDERFYSHRRAEATHAVTGRFAAVIRLLDPPGTA